MEKGLAADAGQERTLRLLAWWRRNDAFRDGAIGEARPTSPGCRANIEALAQLLDEAIENDRVMKAEVLRELGEFDAARAVLEHVGSPDYAAVVRQLLELCNARDTRVRELDFGRKGPL